jgi:hypothetical protein
LFTGRDEAPADKSAHRFPSCRATAYENARLIVSAPNSAVVLRGATLDGSQPPH